MLVKGGKPDILIFAAAIALLSIGLVMVFSASSVMGIADYGDPYRYLQRQTVLAAVGLAALFILMRIDYHIFKVLALPGLIVSFALLVLVLFVGQGTSGATRWIRLGGFNLQPSEIAKFTMINYAAVYISTKRDRVRRFFTGLLPLLVILGVKFGLIMLEPDFGTAAALAFAALVVIFAGGAHLGQLVLLGALAAPVVWQLVVKEEYRFRRLTAFWNPWADPTGAGWNIIQSLLAIGSGGLFGLGLGRSRQKFSYLPEHHTDFILRFCVRIRFRGRGHGSAPVLCVSMARPKDCSASTGHVRFAAGHRHHRYDCLSGHDQYGRGYRFPACYRDPAAVYQPRWFVALN